MQQLAQIRLRRVTERGKGAETIRKLSPMARREAKLGLAYLSPWLFGFMVFTLIPIVATLIFTFMELRITDGIFNTPKFVGFDNYAKLFRDSAVWNIESTGAPGSLWVTIRFGLIALPVGILAPLGLALLMNNRYLIGKNVFRSLFYMPYIVPFVAAVFLWGGMLNSETGWINRALEALGVPRANLPGWVNDVNQVYPAYVILGIWGVGNAMLIMLAGLQSVPTELYDAAKVDGAGPLRMFRHITFPMISPVIFYNLVLSIVGLFQYFLVPLVVNQGTGRPAGATNFYNLYLYRNFFVFQDMAYGATLAWVLFIIILIITILLFVTARFWVYYAGESQ
jgi:multiple sugar transport system permease protein